MASKISTRLPGAKYKIVFDRGRSVKGRLVAAWYLASPDADRMAGVVVSKKSFHEAVDRNRAKRLMREAFRLLVREGAMPVNTMWIFVGRSAMIGKRMEDVKADIAILGKRVSGNAEPDVR